MKHLNVRDVIAVQQKHIAKRNEAFDIILESCYKKIQKSIDTIRTNTHCFFQVPDFLIGYPLYGMNECVLYIVQQLITNGFQVKYFFPKVIAIGWFVEKIHPQPKKLTHSQPKPKQQKPNKVIVNKNGRYINLDI
jgi:hypothetical protein